MASGSLGFVILQGANGPYTFNGELWLSGKLVAQRSLSLARRGPFKLDIQGGKAWGFNRRVQVTFPGGALPEAVDVEVRPLPAKDNTPLLGGNPFEIVALSQATGEEVHQFTQPITIEVSYDAAQFGNHESALKLFYYNEGAQDWYPLDTVVDTEHHRLTAWSDHLTIFDFQAQDWEAARLPNLKAFQVSSFTGASSYSMQIEVPPGPAGLQPSVSLSYNSQTVDGASSRTQASWVGMGWSLGESYIQRNQNGTPDYEGTEYEDRGDRDDDYSDSLCNPGSSNNWCGSDGDDTFSLVVNGQSWTLLRLPDNDGDQNTIEYRTAPESFWRIIRYHSHGDRGGYPGDTSYWYVWDKSGMRYQFESNAVYPAYPNLCSSVFMQTWQWSLTKTRNVFGQEMTYTYTYEMSPTPKYSRDCSGYQATTTLAVYPAEIIYPNNRYKVSFVLSGTLRNDYENSWDFANSTVLYMRSKLDHIEIWQNPDGTWGNGDERLIRKYVLAYIDQFAYAWPAGGKTFTLSSITEYGLDGTSSLPATTFTYDYGRLLAGNNGYGGQMKYTYEANPWYEVDEEAVSCGEAGHYSGNGYMDETVWCPALNVFKNWFGPKQVYKISVSVKSDGGSTARVGMDDGVTTQYGNVLNLTGSYQLLESYFTLSGNAIQARAKLDCPGGGCFVGSYKVTPVTTHYRVVNRSAYDPNGEHGANIVNTYRYDESATNDAAHSALVASVPENQRYTPAYSEYRGNGMVKEIDPGGKVSTTFYYQDDNRNGNASMSLVGTESLTETFPTLNWTDYASKWASGSPTPVFERVTGDIAAKVVDTAGTWNSSIFRTAYSVENNEAVIVQFRLSTTTQQTIIALNSSTPDYRRWGIKQVSTTLYLTNCIDSSSACDTANPTIVLLQNVVPNAWYVLLLIVDDDAVDDADHHTLDHFLVRVWQRDDPSLAGAYEAEMASDWSTRDWRFMAKVNTGTLWLGEYSEGRLYSLNSTYYATQDFTAATHPLPKKEDGTAYLDLKRTWTYVTNQTARNFEGDATWIGTRTTNEYNPSEQGGVQYGNLTRVLESVWDPTYNGNQGGWQDYRLTRTKFYPNAGTGVNLVGLPAIVKTYSCNATDYNGACSANYVEDHLTSSQWSIYDSNSSFDQVPTEGKLYKQRVLLRCQGTCATNGNQYFSDTAFGYDTYGNRSTTTVYTGEGTYSSFGLGTARSSYTCYGGGGTLGGNACAEDYYHTYALWERNTAPTPHYTQIIYSTQGAVYGTTATGYTLGVPVSIIDPNYYVIDQTHATTTAEYDRFGRITAILRYGDDHTNPTARMYYYDTASPFYTEAQQRITGSTYFKIRKYYNGLGQLLQTQVMGAVVNGASQDILVDTWFDSRGLTWKTSVPYAVATGSGYHNRDSSKTYNAHTIYDALGRMSYVYATDNTYTHYVYKDLETEVTDANGYTTHTITDVWGRTERVIPPTGASVWYSSYDTQGHLLQVVYGSSATTYMTYDIAGRKLTMDDPDLGDWDYTYDALGNLSYQDDAKHQRICMYYDSLNRLTGKYYTTDTTNCPSSPTMNATYTYDSTSGSNMGVGRRTGMSNTSNGVTVTVSWKYDERGRTLSETRGIGSDTFLTQWTYNSADLPATMTYPGNNSGGAGEVLTYNYHPQMLVNYVLSNTNSYYYVQNSQYDAGGRTEYLKLGAANLTNNPLLVTDYAYNLWTVDAGRLQYLKEGLYGTPTSLEYFEYDYDAVGNVNWIKDYNAGGTQTQTFHYDGLNRLKDATASGGTGGTYALENYYYDSNTGNLSSKAGVSYTYQDSAHQHAVTHLGGTQKYWYDANGNMTTRISGTNTYNFTYDTENHLLSVSGATTATFVYDADGVRVRGTSGGVTTRYIGSYYEWTTAGSTNYYYAGSTRVAERRTGYASNNGLFWLTGDHLGSTSVTANSSGTKTAEVRYKPWGEDRFTSGTTLTTMKYTGQREESSFGLYYYGARWYDSSLSRWTQPDSIVPVASQGVQAWDRFAYSNNNPVTYKDPSGHDACSTSNYNAPGCGGPNDPAKAVEYYKSQGAYDSAIQSAIDIYGVNTEYISSISYNDRMPTYTNALTNPDRSVEVGYSTLFYGQPFDINKDPHTPGFLAATIAHEEIHAEQIVEGTSSYNLKPSDETWDQYLNSKPTTFEAQVGYMNEYEAYKKIGDSADTYRLSGAEKAWMEQRANDNLALMSPEYQIRAENGWYQMGPAPWEGH